ncbi:MAG TPA: TGS domain-containing protein, partial [Candidatus Sumerlaeota bacterium]|nr:TGS domain-containing protein [Candidatus Sumerlaeota bacterium]
MAITITLPDGSQRSLPDGATVLDLAQSIGAGLARAALAGQVNGTLCDLTTPLTDGAQAAIVTDKSPEGPQILRHTAAHVLAMAVKRLYPEAKLEDGPATENGFFYDIQMPVSIGPDELPAIESEMEKIVAEDLPLARRVLNREEAIAFFTQRSETFKVETIQDLPADAVISVYEMGAFADLCRGPHLPRTGLVKAFKIMSLAGAYRKGDATREQLVRFHGIAFPDKKQMKEYLDLIEEAKKRDHRRIGQDLELFSFHDEGPGFPFFHPKGTILYNTLLAFMREELDK